MELLLLKGNAHDNLIINSNKTEVLQAERQILSKYEELILNNETSIN